jgi:hypothetical protein
LIRIVPPHPGIGEAPAVTSAAQLTYRGGPLLPAAEVAAVFLGDWTTAGMQPIEDFLVSIVPSSYLDALSEYNVGHGSYRGTWNLPWTAGPPPPPPPPPPPGGCLPTFGLARLRRADLPKFATQPAPTTIDDSEIRSRLNAAITATTLPAKTANSLYMVFVQPGVTVTLGGDASCSKFCGYHDSDGNGLYYGVIPDPGCLGCTGTLSAFSALCSVTSHELSEAVTDPVPGLGWYDDQNGEIGDICAWQTRLLNGYTVQLEWLNSTNSCS